MIQRFVTLRTMVTDIPSGFGPALLHGLAELPTPEDPAIGF